MDKKLKIGLIGLGGIMTETHMRAYKDNDDVEIVAICDILPEKIERLKERYSIESVHEYTDYKELLKNETLDFVDICTPNYLHSIIAVDALNSGVNVFCEKPDAISVSEALRMKEAAEKNEKHLMVMRNNRYRSKSVYLKNYIEEGSMGEVYCGRCGWQRRRGIPGKGGWFTTKEQSGGGPLIDLGVHMIDLAIWLMGNPTPVAVSGATYCKFADSNVSDSVHSGFGVAKEDGIFDVEDLAMGFIKFDNGACLQVECSWASNIEQENVFVELRGTKAGAIMTDETIKVFTEKDGVLEDILPKLSDGPNAHIDNIKHFIDVIKNNEKPKFKPIEGLNMIKILEAMYESAETGFEVRL